MPFKLAETNRKGLLHIGLRLPVYLYRAHLGWLLGNRVLLLTHYGRKTGLPHQTVLEVVQHNREIGSFVVASGWGEKADWYQNILVKPKVMVESGRQRFVAIASRLPVPAAEQALTDYARQHPVAFRELASLMLGERPGDPQEAIQKMAQVIPLIDLQPDNPL